MAIASDEMALFFRERFYSKVPAGREPAAWSRGTRLEFYECRLFSAPWGGVTYRGPMLSREDDAFLVEVLDGRRSRIVDGEGHWDRAKRLSHIEVTLTTFAGKIGFVPVLTYVVPGSEPLEMRLKVNPYFSSCFPRMKKIKSFIDYFRDVKVALF